MSYGFLYSLVDLVFQALYLLLFIRVILSWIPHDPSHPIVAFIYRITEPILRPFQGIVPAYRIGLDISPIFAFIALGILKNIILKLLF